MVRDLFSVRCGPTVAKPAGAALFSDFESVSKGWSKELRGDVVVNYYPMCGRKSLKNPAFLVKEPATKSISLRSNPHVCQLLHLSPIAMVTI